MQLLRFDLFINDLHIHRFIRVVMTAQDRKVVVNTHTSLLQSCHLLLRKCNVLIHSNLDTRNEEFPLDDLTMNARWGSSEQLNNDI